MRELAPLPISLATNAYELMEDVNRAILEEPKRLNMSNWVSMFKGEDLTKYKYHENPACGTVCCYAGWTVALKGLNPSEIVMGATASDVGHKAVALLGGRDNEDLAYELDSAFRGTEVLVPEEDWDEDGCTYDPGTPAYATAVVARFRVIMDKHEAHLRATAV